MKRKLLCTLLAAASLICAVPVQVAAASERTVPVQVDGEILSGVSTLRAGVTYVPLRTLLESFGDWDVWWDAQSEAAKAATDGFHITADPAEGTITVNGITYLGIVYVQNGRTYVPLRLLVTQLGGGVSWDPYLGGAAVSSPEAEYDAADLYWLSRIISAESQGESLKGQIAVGNVVLNRVEADDFPDTIPAVIFDRKNGTQFQPVDNGTVYQTPTALSVEAARQVLDGEVVLEDALYFYAPALSQGTWINSSRTYLTTIGCHRFYR